MKCVRAKKRPAVISDLFGVTLIILSVLELVIN